MAELVVVALRAFAWDFRIESPGAPPVTLELTRFRDRATFTWSGSEYHVQARRGLLRRSYTMSRGGVIVARAESSGPFRRSYEVTAGERKVRLRRTGFLPRAMLVEHNRERLGEIRRTSLFRRDVSASIDDRIEGATRVFLIFLALVDWRRASRRHN